MNLGRTPPTEGSTTTLAEPDLKRLRPRRMARNLLRKLQQAVCFWLALISTTKGRCQPGEKHVTGPAGFQQASKVRRRRAR